MCPLKIKKVSRFTFAIDFESKPPGYPALATPSLAQYLCFKRTQFPCNYDSVGLPILEGKESVVTAKAKIRLICHTDGN